MININDLGIEGIDTTTHDVVVGDTHITVKENLPVLEKMELIADIVNSSIDDNDFYNPCLGKINTLIKLVFAYTDIEEPEDMSNFDIYDIFSNGVFQAVMPIIANTPDYNFILFGVEEFTKNIYEYRNSARGIQRLRVQKWLKTFWINQVNLSILIFKQSREIVRRLFFDGLIFIFAQK